MATMSAAEYQAFARNDFYTFLDRAFRELNPRTSFLHNWHNEFIASRLEACPARGGHSTDFQRASPLA